MKVRTLGASRVIQELVGTGARVLLDALVVYYRLVEAESGVAIQVSRRYGCAVKRNRFRRRIKEICRLTFPRFRKQGEFVVIARGAAFKRNFHDLYSVLEHFFKTAGFLPGEGEER